MLNPDPRQVCVNVLQDLRGLWLALRQRPKPGEHPSRVLTVALTSSWCAMRALIERGDIPIALFEMGTVLGATESDSVWFASERAQLTANATRLMSILSRTTPGEITEWLAPFADWLRTPESLAREGSSR